MNVPQFFLDLFTPAEFQRGFPARLFRRHPQSDVVIRQPFNVKVQLGVELRLKHPFAEK